MSSGRGTGSRSQPSSAGSSAPVFPPGLIPLVVVLAFILGVLAIVFGLVARGRAKREPRRGRQGMALAAPHGLGANRSTP